MGMPLELNTMIVTKGNEKRINSNDFSLHKEGYRLYPIEIPLTVRKTIEGDDIGTGVIKKITWEQGSTVITYELKSLHSVN